MKNRIQILIAAIFLLATAGQGIGAAAVSGEKFLFMARERAALQNSFADLRGQVTHLRRNQGGASYYPIRFVIRFTSRKVQAKLFLNNREKHTFERDLRSRKVKIANNVPGKTLLSQLGFEIGDLTMNFLDYPVHSELAGETVKTLKCRVFLLRSPENKLVKVWISQEYFFALKAEFYDSVDAKNLKTVRTLEITGFKKVNDYYVATDIALFSKDYRSRIAFGNCQASASDTPQAANEFK